ncbi:MAG: sulfite exporter TauE/SafE family protein [Pseudomonadota bacterium]
MAFSTNLLPLLGLLLAAGAISGLLAGLLGVGGGMVLVPAFFYIFVSLGHEFEGVMQVCLASSLATIIVTSSLSVFTHHRNGTVLWSILQSWALPVGLGAIAGMLTANSLRNDALIVIFAVLALGLSALMTFGGAFKPKEVEMPKGLKRLGFGLGTGFLSTLMGIGGGSIATPIMLVHGVSIHKAISTAAGFGFIIAVPAVAGFLLSPTSPEAPIGTIGAVNLPAVLIVLSASILTTPYGAKLTHRIDTKRLKRVFGLFLALVALNMMRRAFLG